MAAVGALISIVIACGLFLFMRNISAAEALLYESLPFYSPRIIGDPAPTPGEYVVVTDGLDVSARQSESIEYAPPRLGGSLVGMGDVVIETALPAVITTSAPAPLPITAGDADAMAGLADIDELKKHFYVVESKSDGVTATGMMPDRFDVNKFMAADLSLPPATGEPQVIIIHTHAREAYADSREGVPEDGVVGVGAALAAELENRYGIRCLHVTDSFDTMNGKSMIDGSYERMEAVVTGIIARNPGLRMLVDIHRDAVGSEKLLTVINGVPTARIMFVNGLSLLREDDGQLYPIEGFENSYLDTNLALSFRLQLAANELYPDFTRKIYLKPWRYSLNMLPMSALVEVGATTNTVSEAMAASQPLAELLAYVVN
jgi:stage II sporulation protein P